MNGDYISRAEAWQAIFDSAGKVLEHESPEAESTLVYQIATRTAMRAVESIRPADVRPVAHGHWKHEHLASTSGGTYEVIRCSECGWAYPMFETAYCPCCGTDMREVSE